MPATIDRDGVEIVAMKELVDFEGLRLPAPVRRRLQQTKATPIEFIDTVRYRLLAKRGRG
jgi:hypothetical protein